jgi:hypothetical protein
LNYPQKSILMKAGAITHITPRSLRRGLPGMICLMFGVSSVAQAQELPKSTLLWREWMSELQREQSQADKARLYLTTKRVITQTGPRKARFENGSYSFMLADGTVPDTDADLDRYTDVFEDSNPFANRDNPGLIPLDGQGNPLPQDANEFPLLLLGNGGLMRISNSTTIDNQGVIVDPKRGNAAVQIVSSPPSAMQKGLYFEDFGARFFFLDPNTGFTRQFPLPLYFLERFYPNRGDARKLESELVPGLYQVQYPTLLNPPLGRGAVAVVHDIVPNGSLTKGLKRPNWLIRSITNHEQLGKPPVAKSWADGRIQIDPYLPVTVTWDSLAGLATAQDFIDFFVLEEDDDGANGRLLSDVFRVSAAQTGISFDMSSFMLFYFGNIQDYVGDNAPPPTLNANIYMRYFRIARGRSAADLSEVLLKVPVRLQVSYASWRLAWFTQNFMDEKIAGPKADPDKDGLTNKQEFELGTNPTVPSPEAVAKMPLVFLPDKAVVKGKGVNRRLEVSGRVAKNREVASIDVRLNGQTLAATVKSGKWTASIPVDEIRPFIPEGDTTAELEVDAQDQLGNSYEEEETVRLPKKF